MNKHLKGFIAFMIVGLIVIFAVKFYKGYSDDKKQKKTSDAREIKGKIVIGIDSWVGYFPLCSKDMQKRMRASGYNLKCVDDSADYPKRMKELKKGSLDFAVATIDSYVLNGSKEEFPGTIVMVIDESKGGDAILARKGKISSLDDLKTKKYKIAFTPNSPSEHLLRAVGAHFDIPDLRVKSSKNKVKATSSEDALEKLISGKVDAAVLWEPNVSKAAATKGIIKLLGTEDTSKLIVDILVVNRDFSEKHPDRVEILLSNYFRTLKKYHDEPEVLEKDVAAYTKVPENHVDSMLNGVEWVNLKNNGENWFGVTIFGQNNEEGLINTIESTTQILLDSKEFSSNPLPDEDPYRITNSQFIEKLYMQSSSGQFDSVDKSSTTAGSIDKTLKPLDDKGWSALREVGTLKIRPITFMSGTSRLNLEGKTELDKVVNTLKHYPNFRVLVKGHTGLKGDEEANKELSKDRAESVKKYLTITYNIDKNRIKAVGIGSSEPLPRQPEESDRAYSYRLPRVELYLLSEVF